MRNLFFATQYADMNYTTFLREISTDSLLADCGRFRLISAGAAHFCEANGLKTVGDLLSFHHIHYHFNGTLPSCTTTIGNLLKAFCKQFWHLRRESSEPLLAPVLDEVQFENFVRFMRVCAKGLPSPLHSLFYVDDAQRVYREYIQGNKSFHFLGNVPRGSVLSDFEAVRTELRHYAAQVINQPACTEFDQLVETCVNHYGCQAAELEVFRPLADAGNFPLFGFVAYLIDNGAVFSKNERLVMEDGLGYFKGKIKQDDTRLIQSIGIGTLGLEKLKKDIPNVIAKRLQYLKGHAAYIKRQTKYSFDTHASHLFFTELEAERFNIAEEANFHPSFLTALVWALFAPENQLVYFRQGGFRNNFMVKKDIAEAFNFGAFFMLLGPNLLTYHNAGRWPEVMDSIARFFKGPSIVYKPIVVQILTQMTKEYVIFERAKWLKLDNYLPSATKSEEPKSLA